MRCISETRSVRPKCNKIQHVYHDYLDETEDEVVCREKTRKAPRGGVTTPFPVKLHNLLESNEWSDIISWQPHGRCFVIRKPEEFINTVMPRHFRQTKLTSFQRQLNLYCFLRITSGRDKGCYYHELFLRGKPHLCERMIRMKIKGTRIKGSSNPEQEPNFYAMTPAPPKREIDVVTEVKISQNQNKTAQQVNFRNSSMIVPPTLGLDSTDQEMMNITLPEIKSTYENGVSVDQDLCIFEGKGFHYLDSFVSKCNFHDETNLLFPTVEYHCT